MVISISAFMANRQHRFRTRLFREVGQFSMSIYLFHTLFESTIRITFTKVFPGYLPFEITAFFAIIVGVVFPLFIEKLVLRRYALTRRLVLGL